MKEKKETPEVITLDKFKEGLDAGILINDVDIKCPRCNGGYLLREEMQRITGAGRPEIRLTCESCGKKATA